MTAITTMSVTELATVSFLTAPDYTGAVDPFTYVVSDDEGDATASDAGSVGSVAITITAVNDAPTPVDDGPVAVTEDTPVSGNVLDGTSGGLDSDVDGEGCSEC